jgi:hypothetical protein
VHIYGYAGDRHHRAEEGLGRDRLERRPEHRHEPRCARRRPGAQPDQRRLDTGTYYVSESVTNASDYTSSLACFNDNGAGTGGIADDGIKNGTEPAVLPGASDSVSVGSGDHVICTYTNTRKRGTIELKKAWVGTAGQTTLNIGVAAGGSTIASTLTGANGGAPLTTTQKAVDTGSYYVSETGGLSAYNSSLACFNDNGAGGGTANNGIKDGAEPTLSPGTNNSVSVGDGDHVICTFTNTRNQGTIVIQKITKPIGASTSFNFQTNPEPPYTHFSLASGGTNSQTLDTGTYTVKELVPLGWVLTGIGGSTDPNTPYNCTVTGSGGSTGVGDLATQTSTISLKNGDTVTCVFENTGQGVTRTQGFWATHTPLANIAWFGGPAFGHNFPGVGSAIGNRTIDGAAPCPRLIDTLGKLMGGFWSDVSKLSTGGKRSALDQARMQLAQQLLAAELNTSAFGSVPAGGAATFTTWENAFCGTNQNAIKNAQQGAASFNSQGDSSLFTPGTSADSKYARSIANLVFWNVLP